jgi:hypothetical protein
MFPQFSAHLQKEQYVSLVLHTCHWEIMEQSQQLCHERRRKGRRLMEEWILGVGEAPLFLGNSCVYLQKKVWGFPTYNKQWSSTFTSTSKGCFVAFLANILQMTKSRVPILPQLLCSHEFHDPIVLLVLRWQIVLIRFKGRILRVSRQQSRASWAIQSARLLVKSRLSCILPSHQGHITSYPTPRIRLPRLLSCNKVGGWPQVMLSFMHFLHSQTPH